MFLGYHYTVFTVFNLCRVITMCINCNSMYTFFTADILIKQPKKILFKRCTYMSVFKKSKDNIHIIRLIRWPFDYTLNTPQQQQKKQQHINIHTYIPTSGNF